MTAEQRENATAASAQAAGEAAAGKHEADARAQHQASGSTVVVEQASTPDDHAVAWTLNADASASPTLVPSSPPPVNSFERDSADPDVTGRGAGPRRTTGPSGNTPNRVDLSTA